MLTVEEPPTFVPGVIGLAVGETKIGGGAIAVLAGRIGDRSVIGVNRRAHAKDHVQKFKE